jgi:hypothetical protein
MRLDRMDAGGGGPGATLRPVLVLLCIAGALVTNANAAARQASGRGALVATPEPQAPAGPPAAASSPLEAASPEVRYVAGWVARTGDNEGMPYVIVDKLNATVFVLDALGHLDGSAPALLGLAKGVGAVAGHGDRTMAQIGPGERSTPAGRFIASPGRDLHGQDILWIDYDNAIALHRVVEGTPAEHRAQRLQSPTADDNRISYGCINVPVGFYDTVVHPAFAATSGVVYILPETSRAQDMFKRPDARSPAALPPPRSSDTARPAAGIGMPPPDALGRP